MECRWCCWFSCRCSNNIHDCCHWYGDATIHLRCIIDIMILKACGVGMRCGRGRFATRRRSSCLNLQICRRLHHSALITINRESSPTTNTVVVVEEWKIDQRNAWTCCIADECSSQSTRIGLECSAKDSLSFWGVSRQNFLLSRLEAAHSSTKILFSCILILRRIRLG